MGMDGKEEGERGRHSKKKRGRLLILQFRPSPPSSSSPSPL
ncbi:hypothetical protein SLEP1_g36726 [Rubroshorea leprosula]|uniref:Uncharacterized protein n=1 Tax=Rubroshorea leprosula TaxID=152421 RepID=A0AAV5KSC6_9ROSI|nr:hypothetical protein SLEP1_g36726 [Rubroshorea leprosula]